MAENSLPEEMMSEIFFRLAVKQLMRCKCVCKPWLRLISSPHFVKSHLRRVTIASQKKPTLLTILESNSDDASLDLSNSLVNFDSVVTPSAFNSCKAICTCSYHGIVCLILVNGDIVLWNPSIRQCMKIDVPFKPNCSTPVIVEFSFDSVSGDYKVFRLLFPGIGKRKREPLLNVEVYSVATNDWSIITIAVAQNLTTNKLSQRNSTIIINRILYLYIWDQQLISLDLQNCVSQVIPFPASIKQKRSGLLDFEGSLGMVFESGTDIHLWRLEEAASSWTNTFRIQTDFEWVYDYLGARLFFGVQLRHGSIFPTNILYDYEQKKTTSCVGHFYEDRVRAKLKYTETLVSLNGFSPCIEAPINQSLSKG